MTLPRIFVAGATGAVGRVMCRLLTDQGYELFGMTRAPEKAALLESLKVTPVIADVYDADQLTSRLKSIQPTVVVHQLTDLPYGVPAAKMAEARIKNDKIRDVGTRNLIQASQEVDVTRFVAQSIAFAYQEGPLPHAESAPLSSEGLRNFENQVLTGNFEGIVLRYGRFYGPHTGAETIPVSCRVHVDAAAQAAVLAIQHGHKGVYNIAEDDTVTPQPGDAVTSRKAIAELGWNPSFRMDEA